MKAHKTFVLTCEEKKFFYEEQNGTTKMIRMLYRVHSPPESVGRPDIFYSVSRASRLKKSSSIFGILSLEGQRSLGSTRNALARQSNSKSETHRNCVSIFASVSRLKSHPHRRTRAANNGCVKPCWSRNLRICGPTRFRGFFMFRIRKHDARKSAKSKGSEFRTSFYLPTTTAFVKKCLWECARLKEKTEQEKIF
jgi:hypothetical protein